MKTLHIANLAWKEFTLTGQRKDKSATPGLVLAAEVTQIQGTLISFHITRIHPVFSDERSRMLLMLICSFNRQTPSCAPANDKRLLPALTD